MDRAQRGDADADAVKAALRESAVRARRALEAGERRRASEAIVARILRLPELVSVRTVAMYAALSEEVDLASAVAPLHARGARTLFPRVRGPELELVDTVDLRTLTLGYRGVQEPEGPEIDPDVVDLVLVPGVAFDLAGGRVGSGGGHYDRLLARLPDDCLRIGVAFACQLVPRVPRLDHDEPVDLIVTEAATYRTHARTVDIPG